MLGANKGVYCYNLFAYCSNNPTNLTDPNGTFAGAIFGLIYAAATVVTTAVTSYAFGQSKPNTGITWEDVGNAIWNTIVFIVDPVGSTIRALNPPAVQEARKKEIVRPKIEVLPREFIKDSTFPSLKRPTFPYNPDMFHPRGLVIGFTEKTTNGWIYKWNIPGTTISIFEWDEDYEKGQHYHVMMPGMKNQHKEGNHYVPGTAIPEPWASMYF